jgi:hypothetical protein
MPKPLRCLTITLNDIPEEYKIILGYLTYHSGKLYNQALYLLKNRLAKANMFDIYNKLNSSIHLKALQSRSAQIVLDEFVRKNNPHRTITYDKTGFKVIGTKIRLSLSKELRRWLREKHDIHVKHLWIETGLELREELIKNILRHGVKEIRIGDAVKNKNREIPHGKVKEYLEYKAEVHGIVVDYVDEKYTSGVDSSIYGTVSKETYTSEARVKRGLFKTSRGYLNADVSAVRNMLKRLGKLDPETGLEKPVRLRVFYRLSKSGPAYSGEALHL